MKRSTTKKPAARGTTAELKDAPVAYAAEPPAATVPMVRTQIYLSRSEHHFVQGEATRRGEPMAAVIRSYIEERMALPEEVWADNPLLAPPADPAFVGPKDGVINHDHYVYGGPKKWVKRRGKWVEAPPLPDDYYSHPKHAAVYDRLLEKTE